MRYIVHIEEGNFFIHDDQTSTWQNTILGLYKITMLDEFYKYRTELVCTPESIGEVWRQAMKAIDKKVN